MLAGTGRHVPEQLRGRGYRWALLLTCPLLGWLSSLIKSTHQRQVTWGMRRVGGPAFPVEGWLVRTRNHGEEQSQPQGILSNRGPALSRVPAGCFRGTWLDPPTTSMPEALDRLHSVIVLVFRL